MTMIHATGIRFEGKGVLIRGPSGAGKSDLALRLMARGAELIGDDYVDVVVGRDGRLEMKAPPNIAGRIEVRQVGLLEVAYRASSTLDFILDLVGPKDRVGLERLPEAKVARLEGREIPCLAFYALESAAPEKLRAALKIFVP